MITKNKILFFSVILLFFFLIFLFMLSNKSNNNLDNFKKNKSYNEINIFEDNRDGHKIDYDKFNESHKSDVDLDINKEIKINNYESCISAGYPSSKTYPKECVTSNGIVFFEVEN